MELKESGAGVTLYDVSFIKLLNMPSNIVGFGGSWCLQWLEGIKTTIWDKLVQAAHLSLQRWKGFVS